MDLWQLQIFCKVVELASFSKAGQAIHLSQPTVSSHIKDLEHHFGCPLIDRLSRRAVPTRAGELLYAQALKLLDLRDETEMVIANFQGHYRGPLRIGASTIPGGYLLPRIIGGFNRRYPDIRISIIIGDSHEIAMKIRNGTVEMGVIGARFPGEEHLVETSWMSDTLKLIVPSTHRWGTKSSITIEELRKEPLIVREKGSGTLRTLNKALLARDLKVDERLHIVAEIGNTAGVIGGIKSGLGVSVLSPKAIEDELANATLKALDIDGLDLERQFYLVYDQRRTLSPLAQAFQRYILQPGEEK